MTNSAKKLNKQLLRKADTFEMKEVEESTTIQDKSEYLLIDPGYRRNLLHYETVREIYQICERGFCKFLYERTII